MADFAKEFLKHAGDPGKRKGKKNAARAAVSAVVSHSGTAGVSSGSPAAKVTSPLGPSSARVKRQRGPDDVIDVDVEVGFMLPQCHEFGNLFEDYPLKVPESEKKVIREKRGQDLARDAAGLIRILGTVLTLQEDAANPSPEVQELKGEKALLETKVLGLQNRVQDLLGKQENFV
jgi:hypothetical protein